ncbi:MAG TPA: MerR family transcriptional regulator [Tepidisphaeraceae bacterium]|jgi:DNA-binding transcriptional MerR regulator/quercetin dioxygenase-like cupin family protein|nr:MerR family transcriptional regulator [Tepidisphaeraceae bacterium]
MAYTVKKVAAMSGVSVRTLHFYDEVGLLKPARYGANGYRFYEEPQLLTLQQILFYRELGLGLKQIGEILGRADFEAANALQSHRKVLEENHARVRRLIETVDKTVEHLKGARTMNSEEMFAGFSVAAGDDRFGEHIKLGGPNGEPIDCKVSAQDTGGAMCVFEFNCNSGGPRHLHYDQDEWIYVIHGEFEFHLDKQKLRAGAGESVFIPRKTSHVFACVGGGPGKIINVYQPAGKMEEFFREIAKYDGKPGILEALGRVGLHHLFDTYGMDLSGPPLAWDGPK